VIKNKNGRTRFEILMIKDNPGVLPSKPKSHMVRNKDGRYHIEYEEIRLNKLLSL